MKSNNTLPAPSAEELDRLEKQVLLHGPTRVIINAEGEAVPPARARQMGLKQPEIILIRDDGWSIGASLDLWKVAERLWPESWVAIMHRTLGEWKIRAWSEYKQLLGMASDVIALRDARKDEAEDVDSWAQRLAKDCPVDGDRNGPLILAFHGLNNATDEAD